MQRSYSVDSGPFLTHRASGSALKSPPVIRRIPLCPVLRRLDMGAGPAVGGLVRCRGVQTEPAEDHEIQAICQRAQASDSSALRLTDQKAFEQDKRIYSPADHPGTPQAALQDRKNALQSMRASIFASTSSLIRSAASRKTNPSIFPDPQKPYQIR